jgi:post-segregation antitoxin (ccd killing protein)
MMRTRQAKKRAVNLFVDVELLDEARRLNINISETLGAASAQRRADGARKALAAGEPGRHFIDQCIYRPSRPAR